MKTIIYDIETIPDLDFGRKHMNLDGLSDEDITKKPRIKISTIHAAKGGECDNVLLTTDMNIKTYNSYQKDSDDEQRVFYVGATRAKEELHVLLPQTTMHFRLAL